MVDPRVELRRRIGESDATVAVVGLGYVGVPLACAFAAAGLAVVGFDTDADRVRTIATGNNPLDPDEPGLSEAIATAVAAGRLRASTDPASLRDADVHLIAVPTPSDVPAIPAYEALRAACDIVGAAIHPGALVVVESTVSPGTMNGIVRETLETRSGLRCEEGFYLGHCPERLMPGKLLGNIRSLARVCGGSSPETAALVAALYGRVVTADLDQTDLVTSELVKTVENAYYDLNIAFANEVALIAERVGADFVQVRQLVNKAPGRNMLLAGSGVGGACIPKDPWLLAAAGAPWVEAHLISAARRVNDGMPAHVADLTREALARHGRPLAQAKVAVLGAAYREDTRDARNSPTVPLVRILRDAGAEVRIHDPFVPEHRRPLEQVTEGVDAVVLMVAHTPYRNIELVRLRRSMRSPVLVDGRRSFDPGQAEAAGLTYVAIGLGRKWDRS